MLTGWIVRLAGQQLAPDPQCKDIDAESHSLVDANSSFWQAIAPIADDHVTSSKTETAGKKPKESIEKESVGKDEKNRVVLRVPSTKNDPNNPHPVLCSQCSKILDSTATASSPRKNVTFQKNEPNSSSPYATPGKQQQLGSRSSSSMMETPKSRSTPIPNNNSNNLFSPRRTESEHDPALVHRILDAAVGLARADPNNAQLRQLFTCCFSTFSVLKIKKLLLNNNSSSAAAVRYLYARSPGHIASFPSGYTPFMAAIHGGNLAAATAVWECVQVQLGSLQQQQQDDATTTTDRVAEYLQCTDILGRNVLHIAYRAGNDDVTKWIAEEVLPLYDLECLQTTVDVAGYSPSGWALMSPVAAVRSKIVPDASLQADPSVQGTPFLPKEERSLRTFGLTMGLSELPGIRIRNEDYTAANIVTDAGTALVTVADGHSDQGQIAKFVAEGSVESLRNILLANSSEAHRSVEDWSSTLTDLCLALDAQLRKRKAQFSGGAVASICVITPTQFVVANVGDCRCILVAKKKKKTQSLSSAGEQPTDDDLLVQATANLSLASTPLAVEDVEVIPLSTDHKPSIPAEAARAVAAGCSIFHEEFQNPAGNTQTIDKIQLRDGDRVAFSRSFGDFDYKAKADLEDTQQAVIAVPEVVVRDRDGNHDLYLVVACDGIWDVYSNEQVAEVILQAAQKEAGANDPAAIGDALLQSCLREGAKDNLSVAVVSLQKEKETPTEGRSLEAEGAYEL